jgi:hypothetical protein
VKECGGGFYPGVQIRRHACGKALIASGAPCVTDDEIAQAEAEEKRLKQ